MMNQNIVEELKKQASGKGVQFALDVVSNLISNPIVLIDLTYRLLAHTNNSVDDDPLWNELVTLGKFSHETVDFFNSEKFIAAYANTDSVALMPSKKLKYNRASTAIYDKEGSQLGSFCVVECCKKFEQRDFEIIEAAAEILAEELIKSGHNDETQIVLRESLINCLIEGKPISIEQAEYGMDELYKGLKKNIYVAAIDIIQYERTLTHLVYFRELFAKLKSDFSYYIYLNNIIGIISTDSPVIGMKKELKELNDFFSKYNIYAGFSESFQNLSELRIYFKQALNALNFGIEANQSGNIFMHSDYRLELFIKNNFEKATELSHPVLHYMEIYDLENGTAYMGTLYKYLQAGMNCEKGAKLSGLSQDELKSTLKKIENVFEIDLNNMNTLFGLFCGMKLADISQKKNAAKD